MLAIAAWLALAPAQKGIDYSQAELLSESSQIGKGKSFLIGVRFTVKPGWHIYWHNPGDSGQEVRVKWNLPKGWKAGELMWPTPQILTEAGLTTYVYTEGPILLTRITRSSTKGSISAHIDWLVCSNVCLPVSQDVTMRSRQFMADALEGALRKLPPRAPTGFAQAELVTKEVVVTARMPQGRAFTAFRFIPWDNDVVRNQPQTKATATNDTVTLHIPKSEYFRAGATRLRGILGAEGPGSSSLTYEIDVPLKRTSGGKS